MVATPAKSPDDLFDGIECEQKPKSPLHKRIKRYVILVLVANIFLLIAVQTLLLQPSVEQLESALVTDDLVRVENAIEQEAQALSLKCQEWSAWDDPYDVIVKPGSKTLQQFVEDNLVDDNFAQMQVALMAMVDNQGRVVWGEVHDHDGRKLADVTDLREFFGRDASRFFSFNDPSNQFNGVVRTANGPMILAARPQINSQYEGPIRGAFLMGKFLDEKLTSRLSLQTRVKFTQWNPESYAAGAVGTSVTPASLGAKDHLQIERDAALLDAYTAVGDDLGNTVFVVHALIPRVVYQQSRHFFTLIQGSVILISAMVILSFGVVLRKEVVRPIVTMKGALRTLASSREATERIAREDPTEIGLLAGDFHRLLDKVSRDMKFLQATEEALRWNEHILRLMAEHTPNGFLLVDVMKSRVLYHNRLFCKIWAPEVDAESSECDPSLEDLRDRVVSKLKDHNVAAVFGETLMNAGDRRVIDAEWALSDDRIVQTYSTQLQSGDGVVIGRYYVFDDITARKRVEEELIRRGLLLEAVATSSNLLITATDHQQAMNEVLAILGTAVGADRAYIFETHPLPGEATPRLSQRFQWVGNDAKSHVERPDLQNISVDPGFRSCYDALCCGLLFRGRVADMPESERARLAADGVVSTLVVPINFEGRLWGFIGFDDCHRDHAWGEVEESILVVAAGSIGADIARKAYEKKLVDNVAELERMNRLMRGRENRVLELKAVINEMHIRLGERPRYTVPDSYYAPSDRSVS